MRAGELGPGPKHERGGQAQVVVGEAAALVAQEDEAADVVADAHRDREQVLDADVVGQVVDELGEAALVVADELFARLDRAEERSGSVDGTVDRLWVQTFQAKARLLGHELLAVRGGEVGAGEAGAHLASNAGGERPDISRLDRALGVRSGREEHPVLLFQLCDQGLHLVELQVQRVGEVVVSDPAHEAADREQDQPADLVRKLVVPVVKPDAGKGRRDNSQARGNRELPALVERAGRDREEARQDGQQRRLAAPAAHIERGAGQDERRCRRRQRDPAGVSAPF